MLKAKLAIKIKEYNNQNYQKIGPESSESVRNPSPLNSPESAASSAVLSVDSYSLPPSSAATDSLVGTPASPVVVNAPSSDANNMDALHLFLETKKLEKQAQILKAKVDARLNEKGITEDSVHYVTTFESEKERLFEEEREQKRNAEKDALLNRKLDPERVIHLLKGNDEFTFGDLQKQHQNNHLKAANNTDTQAYNAFVQNAHEEVEAELQYDPSQSFVPKELRVDPELALVKKQPVAPVKSAPTRAWYKKLGIFAKESFTGLVFVAILPKFLVDDLFERIDSAHFGKKWIHYPVYPFAIGVSVVYSLYRRVIGEPWAKAKQLESSPASAETRTVQSKPKFTFDRNVAFGVSILVGFAVTGLTLLAVLTAAGSPINYSALYSMAIQPAAEAMGLAGYPSTGVFVLTLFSLYAMTALSMIGAGVVAFVQKCISTPRKLDFEMLPMKTVRPEVENKAASENTSIFGHDQKLYGEGTVSKLLTTSSSLMTSSIISPADVAAQQARADQDLTSAQSRSNIPGQL
jgi:hypothetical protein